jgi:putative SOS response-associated peptidase YedK
MCSRFSLAEERDFLASRLGVSAMSLAHYRPRYNIAPRQEHFIVTTEYENRKLSRAKWGLLSIPGNQGREQYWINARAETVESRPTFAEAFSHRRCVIPASGFYEWAGPSSARQPYWIHRRDGNLLLFAGLYVNEDADDNGVPTSFTIVTCVANPTLATIHDRMPVILSDRDAEDWMNPREKAPLSLKALLIPAAEALLAAQPASPLVNNVKNEGPELLASSGTKGQMSFNF